MKDLKKKCMKSGMLLVLLLILGCICTTNCKITTVQAASSTTMKKAYQRMEANMRKFTLMGNIEVLWIWQEEVLDHHMEMGCIFVV